MLNIKNLEKNLQAGKHVIVQNCSGEFKIFSPFKAENGNYRNSGWCYNLEVAKTNIGQYHRDDIQFSDIHTFIGIYEPEFETFKVGDKVLISKDAEKWCKKLGLDWMKSKEEMIGKTFDVYEWKDLMVVVNGYYFPPQALSYPMEEEDDEVEKAIKLLVEKGKIKPGQILI